MRKERPILFSSAMVAALLAGRKTQTRRIVKYPVKCPDYFISVGESKEQGPPLRWCPYGEAGDFLWVRESFRRIPGNVTGSENDYPEEILYKVDGIEGPFKPSIHMPKAASRIWLEVTDIRVERVQDISEQDAIAEGVEKNCKGIIEKCVSCSNLKTGCQGEGEYFHYMRGFDDFSAFSAQESFFSLWEKINGKESLDSNPWVWVVSFKVLSTTGKPETL